MGSPNTTPIHFAFAILIAQRAIRDAIDALDLNNPEAAHIILILARSTLEQRNMPGLLDKAVKKIEASGVKASSAYPIAVATLQKSGALKPGTVKPTAKGVARNKMSPKQRQATR